jgi:hypothetical protein
MQGKDDHLTVIDGSYGQGGGQTLRKPLALSAIHHKPATPPAHPSKPKQSWPWTPASQEVEGT